jgi:hypothetical protein
MMLVTFNDMWFNTFSLTWYGRYAIFTFWLNGENNFIKCICSFSSTQFWKRKRARQNDSIQLLFSSFRPLQFHVFIIMFCSSFSFYSYSIPHVFDCNCNAFYHFHFIHPLTLVYTLTLNQFLMFNSLFYTYYIKYKFERKLKTEIYQCKMFSIFSPH